MKLNKLPVRLCVTVIAFSFLVPLNAPGQVQDVGFHSFDNWAQHAEGIYQLATGKFTQDESVSSDFLHNFQLSASLQRTGLLILAGLVAMLSFIILITRNTLKDELQQLSDIDSNS